MTTITNNAHRPIIEAYELTPTERQEFAYIDWEAIDQGKEDATFFRYQGQLYDLGEFTTTSPNPWTGTLPADSELLKWDGYLLETYFSAIVVRLVNEYVVVGRILS